MISSIVVNLSVIDKFHQKLQSESKNKSRSKPTSKPIQHEGIVQRGLKKDSLRKEYKYTVERTANGLAVIVKTK